MTKTQSGFVLVGGIFVCLLGGAAAASSPFGGSVSADFQNDIVHYCGVAFVLLGIAMFFFGSLRFSRG